MRVLTVLYVSRSWGETLSVKIQFITEQLKTYLGPLILADSVCLGPTLIKGSLAQFRSCTLPHSRFELATVTSFGLVLNEEGQEAGFVLSGPVCIFVSVCTFGHKMIGVLREARFATGGG